MNADYAIVVAGHGSRDPDGVREFEQLVALMRERVGSRRLDYGYLELSRPTMVEAVQASIAAGSQRIVVVPALLLAATHAKNDMPGELLMLQQEFSRVALHFGAAMDLHPLLLRLAQQRIVEAEAQAQVKQYRRRADTCLVVVGRGTSDPDANSEISKLCRMLEEGMGFGASFVCYSGTAKPLVSDGLNMAARLGYRRLIVLPFLLFDGVLVKRIYEAAAALAARHPELEVLTSHYMGVHPDMADVFLERAQEGIEGRAHMNCSLCKYRVQIVGFERQVGEPQRPHHVRATSVPVQQPRRPYVAPPLEAESFRVIDTGRDWNGLAGAEKHVAQRLVQTTGDTAIVDDLFLAPGSVEAGIRALMRCRRVVTDVPVVESGILSELQQDLGVAVWCGMQEREVTLRTPATSLTPAAAGIRLAYERFGNDLIVAIGEAPSAIEETLRLIQHEHWRPQLVIGFPPGFVGAVESKGQLRQCMQVPRLTNMSPKGGALWAAAVVNTLLIEALNRIAAVA